MSVLEAVDPIITSSPTIAALFSIISNRKVCDNWIANNFNNLLFIESNVENRSIFVEDQPGNRETIFADLNFFRYNRIKYDVLNLLSDNILLFLKKMIDNGYYIRVAVDNYYISMNNYTYKKGHLLHPLFIYGYHDLKQCFLIGEFFNTSKYAYYTLPYRELELGYYNSKYSKDETEEYLENIVLLKFDEDYVPEEIALKKIIEDTNDYLCGIESSNKYKYRKRKTNSTYYYGIDNYKAIINSINHNVLDIRSTHVLYDRMVLLSYKLDVLYKSKMVNCNNYNQLKILSSDLKKESLMCRNLSVKILIRKNLSYFPQKDMESLKTRYHSLEAKERYYLECLLDSLN